MFELSLIDYAVRCLENTGTATVKVTKDEWCTGSHHRYSVSKDFGVKKFFFYKI